MKKILLPSVLLACALYGVVAAQAQTDAPYRFSTLAGTAGASGTNDGTGSAARFDSPSGVGVDSGGNVYVADTFNNTIRKITPAGVVTTFAGSAGLNGSADGTGSAARFDAPIGIAVDSGSNVYVADSGNNTIRKITPAGVVTTLAGLAGSTGSTNGTGSAARFNGPRAVAVDSAFNVYVADTFNETIRKVSSSGVVTTLAGFASSSGSTDGTGSAARFNTPRGVAVDSASNVYVADTFNNTIRKITPAGVVTTFAGSAGLSGSTDGIGSAARFFDPIGVAVNALGTVFVADTANETIRRISDTRVVTTLAGSPLTVGSADGIGSAVRFNSPEGLAVFGMGFLYVGDTGNDTVRRGLSTSQLVNISTRLSAGIGNNVSIGGFIVTGTDPKKVVIRGIGPSLPNTLANRLANPTLELHNAANAIIATNDNWKINDQTGLSQQAEVVATGVPPPNNLESAIVVTLAPGGYTAVLAGKNLTTGVGLVEVYDLATTANAVLANISTRGFVQTGQNVMIGGFILSGASGSGDVIVRAIGPSLPNTIANRLADPTLELHDGNGALVASNDNWKINDQTGLSQQAEVEATTIPPSNNLESAIVATLPGGGYTAIVAGKNGGTGVALVEVFNLH